MFRCSEKAGLEQSAVTKTGPGPVFSCVK